MEVNISTILILVAVGQVTSNRIFTSVVQTSKGPVQGEILHTHRYKMQYSSFKGIPFAEPPTGYRRFKPPVEKVPWTETLHALAEGSNCVQKDSFYGSYTGSEDCLYLNVYSPKINYKHESSLKPVMVWIYGGRFLNGYGNSSLYGPDFLLEEDVVVVSFNYRLGILGFLNLNHDNATGNAGLKDQTAALRWVKENIVHFGGDPDKITIFGQSAGAASVDYHVLSDMSKGLFYQSISMSGSPLVTWGFQSAETATEKAFKLGEKLGIKTKDKEELLKVLYDASAEDLTKITKEMTKISAAFRPTVENPEKAPEEEKFLTICPKKKYSNGDFNKGAHLMGIMADESVAFSEDATKLIEEMREVTANVKNVFLKKLFSSAFNGVTKITKMLSTKVLDLISNVLFESGIDKKQKLMAKYNDHPIYYYHMSVKPEFSIHKSIRGINMKGSAHGDDLLYLFHTRLFEIPMNEDKLLSVTKDRIVKLWTNFAKYGHPTPEGESAIFWGFSWPDSREHGSHLDIGENLSVKDNRPTGRMVEILQSAQIGISTCKKILNKL